MKCPDCGSRLAEVTFGLNDRAMRCFRCGGFWIDGNTVNQLPTHKLNQWRRISVDPLWLRGGKGTCPLDNTELTRYIGEVVPRNVHAKRCVRCGKWWFPGDSLFTFIPTLEAKAGYLGLSGNVAEMSKIGLPLMVAVLLLGGIVTGVNLVNTRTQEAVPAATEIQRLSVTYVGNGQAVVTFMGLGKNIFVKMDSRQFEVYCKDQYCQARLTNLEYGKQYKIEVGDGEYVFEAK